MSTHWAPEFGYGMFLDCNEAKAMAKKAFEIQGEEGDADPWDLLELFDASVIDRSERYDTTGIKYLTTCEVEENVEGAMFYGDKYGTVLQDKADNNCYKNIHDMVNYFRKKYSEYLPADFNYEGHMVLFWGANWG